MKISLGKYGIIFYTNYFVASWAAGIAYGPIVFIRPSYINDRGLLEHELVHTRQFWRYCGLNHVFMTRLEREIEAYREQLKWYPDDRTELFAMFISTKYGLTITQEEAARLLREGMRS